jgi:hypothetical protein
MNSDERERQAKQRFITLSLFRFVSVFLVLFGVVILSGRLLPDLEIVGYAFVVLGAVEFFMMPVILKKIWAKQDAEKG